VARLSSLPATVRHVGLHPQRGGGHPAPDAALTPENRLLCRAPTAARGAWQEPRSRNGRLQRPGGDAASHLRRDGSPAGPSRNPCAEGPVRCHAALTVRGSRSCVRSSLMGGGVWAELWPLPCESASSVVVAWVRSSVTLLTCWDDRPSVTVVVRCRPLSRGPEVAQLHRCLARRRVRPVRSRTPGALRSSATRDRIGRLGRANASDYQPTHAKSCGSGVLLDTGSTPAEAPRPFRISISGCALKICVLERCAF
jgi:hypothetical protein